MIIKYLRYLTPGHYTKVLLPVFCLLVLFIIKGAIIGQVENFLSSKVVKNVQLFNVQLGADNADFARALAKKNGEYVSEPDYRTYRNREFIKKQKNDIRIIEKASDIAVIIKETEERAEVVPALPPAPVYELSSIFIGKVKRFAVINKNVVKIGEVLSTGEKVTAIQDGKVLLKGRWGDRWIYVNY